MRKIFLTIIPVFAIAFFHVQMLYAQFDFSNQEHLTQSLNHKTIAEISELYHSEKYSEDESEAMANVALEREVKNNNPLNQFNILRDIGSIRESSNQLSAALQYYQKAELLALKSLNDSSIITIYFDLAITHRKNSNYKGCKEYYTKIIDKCPKDQSSEYLEYAYHGLGNLYQVTGDYEKAVDYFLKSVSAAEQRKNMSGVAMSLQHVAETLLLAKNPEKALDNIEKSYQLALSIKDPELLGLILKDYGQILSSDNKLDQALERFNTAIQYLTAEDAKPYLVKVLMSIADVYALKGEHQTSATYLFKCLNQYESFILNEDLGELYLKIGQYYVSNQENIKAQSYFEKGLDICKKYDLKSAFIKTALALSEIEEKNGHLSRAFDLFKTAKEMEASLFTQEKIAKTAELQFKFDADKSDREIQELKLRQNKILIAGLAILLTSIIFLFFVWAKMKNRTNKALILQKEEIEHQNRRLEESNAALTEFAYASAHDLKEPLRNIGSFISLLKRRYGHTFNEEGLEYMEYVNVGVRKMNKLLEDLLEYSTLVVNTNNSNADLYDTVRFNEVLDEIKTSLHASIQQKKADIQYAKKLPELPMSRLHQTQLFQNLISNAMKFVENKAPIIQIQCEENDNDIIVSVKDNGIGIKQEYSDKVFKLFHRLNRDTNYEGTGVGLSICKNIVEKYKGKIWFESVEHQSSIFYIKLPKKAA
jgi:signal transduction histidine kinase